MGAKKEKQSESKKEVFIDTAILLKIGNEIDGYTAVMNDQDKRKAKDKFIDIYQKVEFAYKKVLAEYRITVEGFEAVSGFKPKNGKKEKKFDPDNQIIKDDKVEKVMAFAKIPMNKKLFCLENEFQKEGQKSCRRLRNEIIHSNSKKAIDEVYARQQELVEAMEAFLDSFKKNGENTSQ